MVNKKIVIAADSFKGSISSSDFANVCEAVINRMLPYCEVIKVPLGDGGEGTVEALTSALRCQEVRCTLFDPLMKPVTAIYGISGDGKTAIMEMSQAAGLTLVAEHERNPMITTSYGVGQMIADALSRGCRKIVMGIGGSATNDGGIGMLKALGFKFFDCNDVEIDGPGTGADLIQVARIDNSTANTALSDAEFIIACDVDNPFCGTNGAAYVFAPQKGADDSMVKALDQGMQNFAEAVNHTYGLDLTTMPGAGAAGGLGGTFKAFLAAKLQAGIDMVLQAVGFDRLIKGASLVITGEGRIDSQTVHGKTPYGVLQAARRQNIPVIALGGSVIHSPELDDAGFAAIFSIQHTPQSLEKAMDADITRRDLSDTLAQVLNLLSHVIL